MKARNFLIFAIFSYRSKRITEKQIATVNSKKKEIGQVQSNVSRETSHLLKICKFPNKVDSEN